MKVWKIVSGILTLIASAIVLLQSCALGVYNAVSFNGSHSGAAGFLVAICFIAGGVVSIASSNSDDIGGDVATATLFAIVAGTWKMKYGVFADLRMWAFWGMVCANLAAVSITTKRD